MKVDQPQGLRRFGGPPGERVELIGHSLRSGKHRTSKLHHNKANPERRTSVSDAPTGLMVETPLIVISAIMLNRMEVLRASGTLAAVTASTTVGAALFLTR
jgi:hypothetical protein